MKMLVAAIVVAFLLPLQALAQSDSSYADSCRAWLALVDAGRYDESWDTASAYFRSKITKEQWAPMIKAVRDAVGPVISRGTAQVTKTDELPNAPFGHYVVIVIPTKFAMNPAATETVILKMENGAWKVAGYFVK